MGFFVGTSEFHPWNLVAKRNCFLPLPPIFRKPPFMSKGSFKQSAPSCFDYIFWITFPPCGLPELSTASEKRVCSNRNGKNTFKVADLSPKHVRKQSSTDGTTTMAMDLNIGFHQGLAV